MMTLIFSLLQENERNTHFVEGQVCISCYERLWWTKNPHLWQQKSFDVDQLRQNTWVNQARIFDPQITNKKQYQQLESDYISEKTTKT